jgi:hypothetical protein
MKAKSKSKAARRFVATIYKLWMMRHLDVPEDVASSLVEKLAAVGKEKRYTRGGRSDRNFETLRTKYIPVLNGEWVRGTSYAGAGGWWTVSHAA